MTFSSKLLSLLKKAPLWLGLLFLVGCPSKSYKKTKSYKKYGATGKRSMISTQGPLSTKAGQLIFKKGGNAVDAAIAVSFAISVERPQSTGLGGGGFLLLKTPESPTPLSFDFREMAPNKSHQKMFLGPSGEEQKGKSINGPLSAGVP
ncbi:MAG: gamma-glutamyltransferase, partial [Bdellovibrionota bacterium]|nr:gamma-glutamyltransferase [Bdellovibrionota bacterium]